MTETLDLASPDADAAALKIAAAAAAAAGDVAGALGLLERAVAMPGATTELWMNLAACRRRLGDPGGALAAVDQALTLDPRSFLALLMRASLLERAGQTRQAAVAYGQALTQAPPSLDRLNAATRKTVLHAQEIHRRHLADQGEFIQTHARDALARCDAMEATRMTAFVEDFVGARKRYRQEPSAFYYPGLPSIPFYDRALFPWLDELEAATDAIAGELEAILAQDAGGFTPYVNYDESLPLDQWRALNRSPDWSAFHILFNGAPVAENCARCPRTLEVLRRMPQPDLPGRSPAAMFSVLKPHTRIPPHTGVSNTRLVTHLPLIVPPGCWFRVGAETREWRPGRAWVFDDTIEHEAANDSDQIRVVLIFDVAQPAISPAEHAAVAAITQALDRFGGAPAPSSI